MCDPVLTEVENFVFLILWIHTCENVRTQSIQTLTAVLQTSFHISITRSHSICLRRDSYSCCFGSMMYTILALWSCLLSSMIFIITMSPFLTVDSTATFPVFPHFFSTLCLHTMLTYFSFSSLTFLLHPYSLLRVWYCNYRSCTSCKFLHLTFKSWIVYERLYWTAGSWVQSVFSFLKSLWLLHVCVKFVFCFLSDDLLF